MVYGTFYEAIINKYTNENPHENPTKIIIIYQILRINLSFQEKASKRSFERFSWRTHLPVALSLQFVSSVESTLPFLFRFFH